MPARFDDGIMGEMGFTRPYSIPQMIAGSIATDLSGRKGGLEFDIEDSGIGPDWVELISQVLRAPVDGNEER